MGLPPLFLSCRFPQKVISIYFGFIKRRCKEKTFIDILKGLEELEVVDKTKWLKLREIRNDIAHEYSFNRDEIVDSIVGIYKVSDELVDIYNSTYNFCKDKFDFLGLDKV